MEQTQTELADKSFYGDQTLGDGIDCQKKTFKSHGAEQRRTIGCDKAWCSDFSAVQCQPRLRHGPNFSLPAGDHDALRPSSFQLKPFRQRSRHYGKGSAGVYKQFNFFSTPCWAGQTSLYVEQSHIKSLFKSNVIVTQPTINATTLTTSPKNINPLDADGTGGQGGLVHTNLAKPTEHSEVKERT